MKSALKRALPLNLAPGLLVATTVGMAAGFLSNSYGAPVMPMNTLPGKLSELDAEQPIVCICHHGVRSMQVALFLEQHGFTKTSNLTGGVHAWAQQVDSTMPTY
jgi:rhodanese-related sulfurtransferase